MAGGGDRTGRLDAVMRQAAQAQKEQRQAGELAVIRAANVQPKRVTWIWPGRIPAGKVTMFDGDPGLGKSTITVDLTARLTTASPMPDGHKPDKPMGVFLLSAEDGVEDTIVPRLKVAGANLDLVTIIDHVTDEGGSRPVELPADLDRIETYAASLLYGEVGYTPGLLVVDPVMAYLGGEVNAHRDQDVRRVLHRLKVMAEITGMGVLAVRHLNKMTGSSALYRGGGSIGLIGAARAGLLVGVDPDNEHRRILAVSKSNLAAQPPSLAYRVVGEELYDTAKVVWEGASGHTADDLLGRPVERAAPKQDEAETFLQDALAGGPRPRAWIEKAAAAKGISWRTVERAKAALEVIVERRGEPGKLPRPHGHVLRDARRHPRGERGMPEEAEAHRGMARRTQDRLHANEAEILKLQEPHLRRWERTEGRGKRGVGLKVITVTHNPHGWRVKTSSGGFPGFEICNSIFDTGPPRCPNPILWKVQTFHRHTIYAAYWCDTHLPAEHRPKEDP